MSTLIVQLPAQPRLSAQRADGVATDPAPRELEYVFSADGQQVTQHGRCTAQALPKAQTVVGVLPPDDIGWHRITAPKAPAARLRPALVGVLEEALLEDESELHLALAPGFKAGEPVWVAAVGKPWLASQLAAIEATGLTVDRVVPAWPPGDTPAAHVFSAQGAVGAAPGSDGLWLAWRDAKGPLCLPLASDATKALLAALDPDQPVQWSACPEGSAEAARLAGTTVVARSQAEFLLAASQGEWNLRQFDLAAQRRGSRVAREWLQRFWNDRAWRPARYGLALLVAVQLVGINLWAWQQRQALTRQKAAMTGLLQATFPQVRAVIDAPAQMQKEVDLLRSAAGKPGEADLEPMMYAAEAAWPNSRGPADALKYEPGRLTITSVGWSPQEVDAFRDRLRPLGLDLEAQPGRLTLSRLRMLDGSPAGNPGPGPSTTAPSPGPGVSPAGAGAMPTSPPPSAAPQRPSPMAPQAQAAPRNSGQVYPAETPPAEAAPPQRPPTGQPLQGNVMRQSAI